MDEEHGALDLLDVVEGDETDVGIRERLRARLHLLHNLGSVGATEHRQLPHSPVPVVVVQHGGRSPEPDGVGGGDVGLIRLRELKARGPAVADDVVNLVDNLTLSHRREEGEGLEELVVNGVPDLEGARPNRGGNLVDGNLLGGGGEAESLHGGSGADGRHCE